MNVSTPEISNSKVQGSFEKKYTAEPAVVIQSPGRVNLIGEHTDYNDGFVLPAAIDYYMYVAVRKNESETINLYSVDYDESVTENFNQIERGDNDWLNLINGVIFQLKDKIQGFDLAFGGNVPEGAGVSSSAALCCGVAMALSELFELQLDKWTLARIAQKSEHDFSLVQCGIMDQFACLFGLTNHVLLLNCLNLEYEETEAYLPGYKFLLINSNVKHNLGDSDYNRRREESNEAIHFLKEKYDKVRSYQDVDLDMLKENLQELPRQVYNRAYHVITENKRVLALSEALKKKDPETVGQFLNEGHRSLKDYYEVTCEQTDFLVDELNKFGEVYGARQVGGGFGGCVLTLTKDKSLDEMLAVIDRSYKKRFNLKVGTIPIRISRGCHRII